ncbi:ISL3 family transposase [uncultured Bacteroides sp.]|uniref:ISL3 family transposase n=1 Tax=uncultured Bacteroides sp. TaxID=162156 RepID=UPI002AAC3C75|nr:ISL3 family transposase [uncultured Bacteroides sp.]
MNTSFLYHAFGVCEQECSRVRYEDKSIIFEVQTRSEKLRCPCCKSRHFIRSGSTIRRFRGVPIGHKPVFLEMKVQRLECKDCHCIRQENIHFITGKRSYTNRLARLVVELSRLGTIKDVAHFLHLSWDTVKDIQKRYLQRHYGCPDLSELEYIGIDEFAVAKGHVYKTIVVNLLTGQVIYIGDGKGADSLDVFWKKLKKSDAVIKAVATDLSPAFVSAVMTNIPEATLVFDHFHVVKLMNDALDEIRRSVYREEKDLNKRKVFKGTRWLLLCNGKDIFDNQFKSRLDNALKLNEPLMKAYYLKESLKEIWAQVNKEQAIKELDAWIEQAYQSKIPKLTTFANTLKAHKWGVLAWYDYHISTGKLEGINNKIKTMKRQAYGYRDQRFFELKILAMHEKNYAFVG